MTPAPMQNTLMSRLAELATISDTPGALTRLFLSPAHKRAIALVEGWMRQAGLETHIDAIGNLVGRTNNYPSKPTLILGSHIDTVRDAGWYDGTFGVLAAIDALENIPYELPYAVEIIAFGDEEGVRFPKPFPAPAPLQGASTPLP